MTRHVTRRSFLVATTGAVVLAGLHRGDQVSASQAEKANVRIVTGLRATSQSLGCIGTEAGVFKRLGIDVSFPAIETAGPEAAAGLVRGDWEFAEVGGAPIIQGVLDGHDTVILLAAQQPEQGSGFLVVRRGITELEQLAGGRVGVLTEAGQTGISARATLRAWGITATLVPLGTFPNIYAALGAGDIDAGVLSVEYRLAGQRVFGLNALPTPGGGFQPPVLGTTRRMISKSREVVARVVQGYVETIHLFKTNRSVAAPLLQRCLKIFDAETIGNVYQYYEPRFQRLPLPSPSGIQSLLHEFASKYPAARTHPPTAFSDTSFLEDLERSGFLARLYGSERKK